MARNHGRIYSSIWHNPDYRSLSSGAQRLYILALTQENLSFCGVTTYTAKRWSALAANTTPNTIRKDLTELAGADFVLVDDNTEEVWVRSFLKWDGVLKSPNLITAMVRDYDAIHSEAIRYAILEYLHEHFPEGLPEPFPEPFRERLAEAFGRGSRVRSAEPPASSLQPPSSSLQPPAPSTTPQPTAPRRDRSFAPNSETEREFPDLANKITGLCEGRNRGRVATEALAVVDWANHHVDRAIIEEAIGWWRTQQSAPDLPRAVAGVIQRKAADHGIRMPAFEPPTKASVA